MADIGNRLRIKYGLKNNPSAAQQKQWADVTEALIRQGYSQEDAGRMAARELFSDFGQMVYASEGDTIEMLLRQINQ